MQKDMISVMILTDFSSRNGILNEYYSYSKQNFEKNTFFLCHVIISFAFGVLQYIFFPTKVHLKNAYYLYSACSNHTYIVLVIA
jgi:hypothetical protein